MNVDTFFLSHRWQRQSTILVTNQTLETWPCMVLCLHLIKSIMASQRTVFWQGYPCSRRHPKAVRSVLRSESRSLVCLINNAVTVWSRICQTSSCTSQNAVCRTIKRSQCVLNQFEPQWGNRSDEKSRCACVVLIKKSKQTRCGCHVTCDVLLSHPGSVLFCCNLHTAGDL